MLLWLFIALASVAPSERKVDFKTDVQPIFEAKCQPCHFPAGKMYDKLPFDRPETIVKLNEKLFTRIKDEPSRATIRRFIASWRGGRPRPPAAR